MDVSSLLLAIASLSASFVAILGGFIASRLITINGERDSCVCQLNEVHGQLVYYRGMRNIIDTNRAEEDAIRYIYDHMAELVEEKDLKEVYEEDELQLIEFDELEPLWIRALEVKAFFDECLQNKKCTLNGDYIPSLAAEEYTEDPFAYEFCKLYAGWGFGEHDFDNTPFRETGNWYESDKQKAIEYTTQIMLLDMREKQLTTSLRALEKPQGMGSGLMLFALFSVFNIILPLVLSLFTFDGYSIFVIAGICILFLAVGLIATFIYLAWMLKWKNKSEAFLHSSASE